MKHHVKTPYSDKAYGARRLRVLPPDHDGDVMVYVKGESFYLDRRDLPAVIRAFVKAWMCSFRHRPTPRG